MPQNKPPILHLRRCDLSEVRDLDSLWFAVMAVLPDRGDRQLAPEEVRCGHMRAQFNQIKRRRLERRSPRQRPV